MVFFFFFCLHTYLPTYLPDWLAGFHRLYHIYFQVHGGIALATRHPL